MKAKVLVFDSIKISCNAQQAITVLHNIENIEKYEPKLISATIRKESDKRGTYKTKGYFAGVPWKGKFSYELRENGFYSEMLKSPLSGLKVEGGFIVEQVAENECKIIHYEQYFHPLWLLTLVPFLKRYLEKEMIKELKDLKEIILDSIKDSG